MKDFDLFQFYCSSINTANKYLSDFNKIVFQFYCSSINTLSSCLTGRLVVTFQFYCSSINTFHCSAPFLFCDLFQFYCSSINTRRIQHLIHHKHRFNSTVVRLTLFSKDFNSAFNSCFNSTVVRLTQITSLCFYFRN